MPNTADTTPKTSNTLKMAGCPKMPVLGNNLNEKMHGRITEIERLRKLPMNAMTRLKNGINAATRTPLTTKAVRTSVPMVIDLAL